MSKVMIVDDDPMMARFAGFILKKGGHTSVSALSGGEALDIIASERPDYVFIDCEMPGMSGMELLETLKGDAALRDIPICMMTGTVTEETTARAISSGAVGCIEKPLVPDVFLGMIK